ncbi:MAG: hypothetical protein SOW94_08180 [Erysipelotrichaceae bacterium]|nr:hypothetical protein [Erysipelotrichaceae bacterium]
MRGNDLKFHLTDGDFLPFAKTLDNLAHNDFNDVCVLTAAKLRSRALKYTPKKTGELRASLIAEDNEVGYIKDYAPHVEFGHRICRPAGHQIGYVEGQHFFERAVNEEKPLFEQRCKHQLENIVKAVKG